MASRQLSCDECNVMFSGPLPYIDHIKSAKHLKKVAAAKQLQSVLGKGDDVTTASETKEAGDKLRLAAALRKDPLPFTCELCNVSMNSEAALIAHNKGKKHMKALKYQEDLLRLATESGSSEPPAEQNSAKASSSTGTPPQKWAIAIEDLACEYCGIVLFKNFGYKLEHLESESHCKKKSQVMDQNVEGSCCEEPSSKRFKAANPLSTEAVSGSGSTCDEAEGNETTEMALPADVLQPTVDEDGSLDGNIVKDLD